MPVFQINGQHHALRVGTIRLGGGPDADIVLPAAGPGGVQAIVDLAPDGRATVRRASPDAQLRVNGVLLGAEPTPLLHGDRLEIGGAELRFAEDAQAGATRVVSSAEIAAVAGRQGPRRATIAQGGRLVSLVDGKEYEIPLEGVTIGRDVTCDVVVPQQDVSRRHAQIVAGPDGYAVHDFSSNGVFVNGTRITQSQLLARADVIRVGSEEFRFYAPVAPATPAINAAVPESAPSAPAPIAMPTPDSVMVGRGAMAAASRGRTTVPSGAPAVAGTPAQREVAREVPRQALDVDTPEDEEARSGLPVWLWVLVVVLILAAIFFVVQGR